MCVCVEGGGGSSKPLAPPVSALLNSLTYPESVKRIIGGHSLCQATGASHTDPIGGEVEAHQSLITPQSLSQRLSPVIRKAIPPKVHMSHTRVSLHRRKSKDFIYTHEGGGGGEDIHKHTTPWALFA